MLTRTPSPSLSSDRISLSSASSSSCQLSLGISFRISCCSCVSVCVCVLPHLERVAQMATVVAWQTQASRRVEISAANQEAVITVTCYFLLLQHALLSISKAPSLSLPLHLTSAAPGAHSVYTCPSFFLLPDPLNTDEFSLSYCIKKTTKLKVIKSRKEGRREGGGGEEKTKKEVGKMNPRVCSPCN